MRLSKVLNDIAVAAPRRDRIGADLAAHASHENFDGVAVRLAFAAIDMVDQFALRDDAPLMVQEIAQQPEFERRKVDAPPRHDDVFRRVSMLMSR